MIVRHYTLWLCQNSYGKWPIEILWIYPLKMVIFHSYVSLPERICERSWFAAKELPSAASACHLKQIHRSNPSTTQGVIGKQELEPMASGYHHWAQSHLWIGKGAGEMRKWTCLQAWKACYPVAKCLITTRLWVPVIGFAMHKSLGFDELGHKGMIGELPANRRTEGRLQYLVYHGCSGSSTLCWQVPPVWWLHGQSLVKKIDWFFACLD